MYPTFNIQSTENSGLPRHLMIQIGKQGISFITINSERKTEALTSYHFNNETDSDAFFAELNSMFDEPLLNDNRFTKVDIVYAFPEAVMVPKEFFNAAVQKEMLELLFGITGDTSIIQTDFLEQHDLYAVYTYTKRLHTLLKERYPNATMTHQYSLLPGIVRATGKHLFCIFDQEAITVMLQADEQLVVIQYYPYKKPEDVAYHLLNICDHFNASPDETTVHLTGMIDENSNLYKELYKYFLHLQFEPLPDQFIYGEGINDYPSHYFSHLYSLATCV